MKNYLLDSGFLYASIDVSDIHYDKVKAVTQTTLSGRVILPAPAITETAYFLSRNLGPESVAQFLENIENTRFVVECPASADYNRAAEILRKYSDSKIDFVDACIVAMSERLDITTILTIDRRDFGIIRPKHCAAFEILP